MFEYPLIWLMTGILVVNPGEDGAARSFAPACRTEHHRALDFWVGEWSVDWRTADGRSGTALSTVVLENGGCVVREHFRDLAGGLEGTGIYSYFAPTRRWMQTWMDNQGITISSSGGASDAGTERFELRLARGPRPDQEYRTVWQDVTPAGFTWRFQVRPAGGAAWTDEGVSIYTRR